MTVRSTLWILIAALSQTQAHRAAVVPLPDPIWRTVTKTGPQIGASNEITVKRASSLAHQNGELRVTAVIGGESPEALLAAGANLLVYPQGLNPGKKDDYL